MRQRRYNPKGKPTKAESDWMGQVAQLPCCNCGAYGVQVNHWAEGFRRLGNFYTMPLCPPCHAKVDSFGSRWKRVQCYLTHRKLGRKWEEPPSKARRGRNLWK